MGEVVESITRGGDRGLFLADTQKTPLKVSVSDKGISTIIVPQFGQTAYGTSPVIIAAELTGAPVPTLLSFGVPGVPAATIDGKMVFEVRQAKGTSSTRSSGTPRKKQIPSNKLNQAFEATS